VAGVPRRIAEAERMGFRRAIVPAGSAVTGPGAAAPGAGTSGTASIEVVEVEDVRQALLAALR